MLRAVHPHLRSLKCRSGRPSFRPRVERLEDRCLLSSLHGNDDREITVMTRNVYVGADFGPVLAAPSLPAAFAAAGVVWGQVQASNFPERAEALADEIAEELPTLIGLQEVSWFRSGAVFNPAPAAINELDFLDLLRDELAERGLSYAVVAESVVFDEELPIIEGGIPTKDLRLTDRDVILARTDLPASQLKLSNIQVGHFAARLQLPLGPEVISFDRGWMSVDAKVRGKSVRFVNTHLEPEFPAPAIQVLQGQELLAGPANTSLPVIMVGDFNSRADGSGTATYGSLIAAGFDDAWSQTRPGDPGYTCCQDALLLNPVSQADQRIDLVLYRGDVRAASTDIVGENPADRTPSGLWPSDHAGVAATLELLNRPNHGSRTVPLLGVFSGQTVAAVPTAVPNTVFVVTTGTGRATGIGSFTMTSPHYSHLDTLAASGTQIITAANGDTIAANFTGQFKAGADGKLRGILKATIVGGTGRFEGAEGGYLFTIVFDPATFQSTALIVGAMRF
jgi:endonuclease/exonuclease/phosphatase family metal-dependent hydrolase